MKYYVIEISAGDIKVAGKGIYEYETETEALASFHQKLGTAMKSELFTRDMVMVVNEVGGVIRSEVFERAEAAAE